MTQPSERFSQLLDALETGDRMRCLRMANAWLREGIDNNEYYNGLLFPAIAAFGERWARNEILIADEHVASEIIRQLITLKAVHTEPLSARKGSAIVGCVPKEQHDIPGLVLSNLLEEDGWDVRFFGASVPADDIVGLAARVQPALAGLVVKTLPRITEAVQLIGELRAAVPGIRILIGGVNDPALRASLQPYVDAFADCPVSAVQLANALVND